MDFKFFNGALVISLGTLLAGEPGSGKLLETSAPSNMTLINGTSAVEINDGQAGTTRLGKMSADTVMTDRWPAGIR